MALLSRVATALYVLGRDLERTEHLARVLRVHWELSLDRSFPRGPRFWPRFLELSGWLPDGPVGREQALETALTDSSGPSVRRSTESARRGAQAVRPSLSTEVWEQVNSLYWQLNGAGWQGEPYAYLHQVELGTQLIAGLVDDTMAHDEAWSFLKLGKYIERAGNVTRLVARKSQELAQHRDDPVAWASVLRCCASFEAFRLRFQTPISAGPVSIFLLLDRISPRSAAFCTGQALTAGREIEGAGARSRPYRLLGQLSAIFEYAEPDAVGRLPVELGARFDPLLAELHRALRETYFQPSRLALSVEGGGEMSHLPQQQQQQQAAG
jgi:uncharacterized alpha-E superfamily protein